MKASRLITGLLAAIGGLGGCTANVYDNNITIPNATVNLTTDVDVDNVMPEQEVPVAVAVTNVYLVEPAAVPPPEHVKDAGHLQIYMDNTSTPPILVTAETNVMVTIPKETKAGHHKVICRVHKHDGTPSTTKFELSITVKVTVTIGPDGGTSVDVSVTVDTGSGSDASATETAATDTAATETAATDTASSS